MSFQDSDKTKSEASAFDAPAASRLVTELRGAFASGKPRSYEWRVSQVKALAKLVADHEQEIVDALQKDLAKPPLETVAYEVLSFIPLSLLLSAFYFLYICGACPLTSVVEGECFENCYSQVDFVIEILCSSFIMVTE